MKIQDILLSFVIFALLILASSCGPNTNSNEETILANNTCSVADSQIYLLKDTSVKVLWSENKFDVKSNSFINTHEVNADYLDTMSDPERAAIGFVSLVAMQHKPSEKNLNFLKQWFRYDNKSLSKIENYPDCSENEKEYEEVKLIVTSDTIKVSFIASTVLSGTASRWEQEDTFRLDENNIRLIDEKFYKLN